MSKIDQKKREKKEALLLSAFELFTEKGEGYFLSLFQR